MTSKTSTGRTPGNVAKLATRRGTRTRRGLLLLGLFGPKNNPSALIRDGGGSIHTVTRGQAIDAGLVIGIDETGVILQKNGRNRRLDLPAR